MMLLFCSKSWCQNNIDSASLYGGDSTKVLIDIDYIKLANKKLIEHKYCNVIINTKDSIIDLERKKYLIADSLYNVEYTKCYNNVKLLEQRIKKQRKINRIVSYSSAAGIAFSVLILLIK